MDLDIRMEFHESSPSNKFTGKSKDWELYFTLECESKHQGLAIETHIKKMKSKVYVENLVQYPEVSQKLLLKYLLTKIRPQKYSRYSHNLE